ncbi:MAG: AraC family transcriptional regulator [Lachnospiraceae bacterium]|nr:AraC family transcriptional regulator [Lachnospiraceae bacterium]
MPGSLIFHPPLSVHSISNDRRRSHLILQFSHKLLNLLNNSQEGVLLPAGELQQQGIVKLQEGSSAWECMQKLLADVPSFSLPVPAGTNEITEYPFSENLRLNAHTLSLLSCLFDDGLIRPEYTDTLSVHLEEMQVLINRLVTHPEEKLSMEEAAAFTHMSYSNFCRSFKLMLGYSYVDFCNMIRVRRAQELLQNSNMSVTEISALLNFGSVSYFNRIFKKITNCTPLVYRASRH